MTASEMSGERREFWLQLHMNANFEVIYSATDYEPDFGVLRMKPAVIRAVQIRPTEVIVSREVLEDCLMAIGKACTSLDSWPNRCLKPVITQLEEILK